MKVLFQADADLNQVKELKFISVATDTVTPC